MANFCGVTADASERFGFSARQIRFLWAKHGTGAMDPAIGVGHSMKSGHGCPKKLTDGAFNEKMSAVSLLKWTMLQSFATEMQLSVSMLWSYYLYKDKIKWYNYKMKLVIMMKTKNLGLNTAVQRYMMGNLITFSMIFILIRSGTI